MERFFYKRLSGLLSVLLACLSLLVTASCDNMSVEERLTYVPLPPVNRNVLIEDFTGQRCVNCPNAADEIHALQQEYGEDVIIAVGIHGGPMAVYPNPDRGIVGLATETGDDYNTYWKVEQWPMGMVNRSGVTPYTSWKGLVRQEMQKTSPVNLLCAFQKDSSHEGSANIRVSVQGTQQGRTNGKLQLWVVEDSIKAIQLMPDGKANANYVHQHVFRAVVNGEWGEDVSVDEGETKESSYSVTFANDWVPENLSIVAFVYSDQGVLQAVRQPLE